MTDNQSYAIFDLPRPRRGLQSFKSLNQPAVDAPSAR